MPRIPDERDGGTDGENKDDTGPDDRPSVPEIAECDWAHLQRVGLTAETIRANQLRTAGEALEFPFFELDGSPMGYTVIRPHHPVVYGKKTAKYLAPGGKACRAYFPAASRLLIAESSLPLHVTEGLTKALALSQHGYAAIGLLGVWNWNVKGTRTLLPDLSALPLLGRDAYVTFDYDPGQITRRNVELARAHLGKALGRAGSGRVYTVELPPSGCGGKQGVDDYLASAGPEAFADLVKSARNGKESP